MEEAVGFKEWQMVLQRLGSGEQSLLLRKGGIHEGQDGFAFKNKEFFLLPSYFHQQAQQLRLADDASLPEAPEGVHRVELFARCEAAAELRSREQVDALRQFHCWSDSLLEQRWDWEGKGMASGSLTAALVRVYALEHPWEIADGPRFRGCRSWFDLGEPPVNWRGSLRPVLDEEQHELRKRAILNCAPSLASIDS